MPYVHQKAPFVYFRNLEVAHSEVFRQFCVTLSTSSKTTQTIYITTMKKYSIALAFLAGALTLSSCGTTGSLGQSTNNNSTLGSANNGSTTGNILSEASTIGSILGNILSGSSKLSQSDLVGTWNYTGSDCVFKSENLLAKDRKSVV